MCRTTAVLSKVAVAREVPREGSSLASQVQCWVPDYSTSTCVAKLSLATCLKYRALGNVYQRWGEGPRHVLHLVPLTCALCCAWLQRKAARTAQTVG